jgi:hypothetical protein
MGTETLEILVQIGQAQQVEENLKGANQQLTQFEKNVARLKKVQAGRLKELDRQAKANAAAFRKRVGQSRFAGPLARFKSPAAAGRLPGLGAVSAPIGVLGTVAPGAIAPITPFFSQVSQFAGVASFAGAGGGVAATFIGVAPFLALLSTAAAPIIARFEERIKQERERLRDERLATLNLLLRTRKEFFEDLIQRLRKEKLGDEVTQKEVAEMLKGHEASLASISSGF